MDKPRHIYDFIELFNKDGNELFLLSLSGITHTMSLNTIKSYCVSESITGATYDTSSGEISFTNSSGGGFSVSGFKTDDLVITGGTYDSSNNKITFVNNAGSTFDVTNLPNDVHITGGTYSNGDVTFTNNTGGTFTVSGFLTSVGDTYWTSGSTGVYSIKTINSSTTDATGGFAVAEGYNTLASGNGSHTEGHSTIASGDYGHAEGYYTTAIGTASHAEGGNTIASGHYSHAGGNNSAAIGTFSFVHGDNSKALNVTTIVFGDNITGSTANTVYVPDLVVNNLKNASSLSTDGDGKLIVTPSDERLKHNINDLSESLDKVNKLRGVSFEFNNDVNVEGTKLGFIAQEVNEILPVLVKKLPDTEDLLTVDYIGVIPVLVEAIKELTKQNLELKRRLDDANL